MVLAGRVNIIPEFASQSAFNSLGKMKAFSGLCPFLAACTAVLPARQPTRTLN
jgi:hypothetical protein